MNRAPLSPHACISLDAAGTLFHLRHTVGHTYASIAAQFGIRLEAEEVEAAFRTAWKELPAPIHQEGHAPEDDDRSWWRELVVLTIRGTSAGDLPEPTIDALFAELYTHFASSEPWQLYPDTIPALERFHPHFRLFVVSNFDRRLHSILQGLGIKKYFERVIISSEVGASKPQSRIFKRAMEVAAAPSTDWIHIGDDRRCDFDGARAAGMGAILLSRPEITLASAADKILSEGISRLHADV